MSLSIALILSYGLLSAPCHGHPSPRQVSSPPLLAHGVARVQVDSVDDHLARPLSRRAACQKQVMYGVHPAHTFTDRSTATRWRTGARRVVQQSPDFPDLVGNRPAGRTRLPSAIPPRAAGQHGDPQRPEPPKIDLMRLAAESCFGTSSRTSRGSSTTPTSRSSNSYSSKPNSMKRSSGTYSRSGTRSPTGCSVNSFATRKSSAGGRSVRPDQPALFLHSVHHLKKVVNGQPASAAVVVVRPRDFRRGDGRCRYTLADLALWFIAPEQAVDYATHIRMLSADREPLLLSEDQFRQVTQLPGLPSRASVSHREQAALLRQNNTATLHAARRSVLLSTAWEYESVGGDTHQSYARGKARDGLQRASSRAAVRSCTFGRRRVGLSGVAEETSRQV